MNNAQSPPPSLFVQLDGQATWQPVTASLNASSTVTATDGDFPPRHLLIGHSAKTAQAWYSLCAALSSGDLEALSAWAADKPALLSLSTEALLNHFRESYIGLFEDRADFAEQYFSSFAGGDALDLHGPIKVLYDLADWNEYARDLESREVTLFSLPSGLLAAFHTYAG